MFRRIKKYPKVSVLALGLTLAGCSSVPPTWLTSDTDPAYPKTTYLLSTGCGSSLENAKFNAMESLADQIQVRVTAKNSYASQRVNLAKSINSKNDITVSSVETLSGVSFSKQFMAGDKNVCVLAALDKIEARKHIMFDIHNTVSEIEVELARANKGDLETLKSVGKIRHLVENIQKDQRVASGIGVGIPDETDYLTRVIQTLASIRRRLTFAIHLSSDDWLSAQLAQALTGIGLKQVSLRDNPAFVVQGGLKWAEIQPPPDSPYFWVGYSAVVSLYSLASKQSVAESVTSNRVAGETRSQAKFQAEEDSNQFVMRFVKKLEN